MSSATNLQVWFDSVELMNDFCEDHGSVEMMDEKSNPPCCVIAAEDGELQVVAQLDGVTDVESVDVYDDDGLDYWMDA